MYYNYVVFGYVCGYLSVLCRHLDSGKRGEGRGCCMSMCHVLLLCSPCPGKSPLNCTCTDVAVVVYTKSSHNSYQKCNGTPLIHHHSKQVS